MRTLDLFPECLRDDCEQAGTTHKHVLPFQQEVLGASEKYLCMLGGYGSGKTLPACVLGVILSLAVPGNLGIVVRRSYSKLHDSTERIFLECLQRAECGFQAKEVRDGWPHRLVLENGSEIVFRETKDLGRFLGPEYGWFYIDEAVEEPEKTFSDLVGRLRLPRAQDYHKGILTSNPPNSPPYAPHWIEEKFGREPGRREVRGENGVTTFRLWRISTRLNPFLPRDYIRDLMLMHTPAEVKRIIEGQYGFSFEGKPVYNPPFDFGKHVGIPPVHPIALARSWDFGFRQPAVSWHQFFICKAGKTHWNILAEYMPSNVESEVLADNVIAMTEQWFPEVPALLIAECGDTAGAQFNEKGPGPIIRLARPRPAGRALMFRHKKFPDIDPGLDLVRTVLRQDCKCGHPLMLVHRRCTSIIDAMAGGYHYAKQPVGKPMPSTLQKPVKDGFYDNIADTIRYAGELFYRPASRDPNFWALLAREQGSPLADEDPMAWMRY